MITAEDELRTEAAVTRDVSHLVGIRVKKWKLDDGSNTHGAYYHGTVTDGATRFDNLVTVTFDVDGSQEEMNSWEYGNCAVPEGAALPRQTTLPPAVRIPPEESKRLRKAARLSGVGAKTPSPRKAAEPPIADGAATPKSAGAKRKSMEPQLSPGGAEVTPKRNKGGRPSLSPKKYNGTTLEASGLWRAQITVAGKYCSVAGFATEEAAAAAWNEMAQRAGRTDLNVLPAGAILAQPAKRKAKTDAAPVPMQVPARAPAQTQAAAAAKAPEATPKRTPCSIM